MSYVVLGFYLHRWLFVEGFAGGVGSRKEDLVDKKGDPKRYCTNLGICFPSCRTG